MLAKHPSNYKNVVAPIKPFITGDVLDNGRSQQSFRTLGNSTAGAGIGYTLV